MSKEMPKIGDVLENGGTVLQSKPFSSHEGDWYLGVVLALFGGQFVTWIYNLDRAGAVEGHYYRDLGAALKDFNERGGY